MTFSGDITWIVNFATFFEKDVKNGGFLADNGKKMYICGCETVEIMKYLSTNEYAEKYGISDRTARNYCADGKIRGAFQTGRTWSIPANAPLPKRRNAVEPVKSALLTTLIDEMESGRRGGIYHRTQIELTYNSNHIEGSRLTEEQTRYIFETNTIGPTKGETVNVDDITETLNHFRCIDLAIGHAQDTLTEEFIKLLHRTLKNNTSDSRKGWFATGEYKRLPNEAGGNETCPPEDVAERMQELIKQYYATDTKTLDDILDFHVQFERIHPFQDGNGRVGRLIMFKECLAAGIVPFIITDEIKLFYYRGLSEWGRTNGYLRDTCLAAQDSYKAHLDYFRIKYKRP